MLSIWKQDAVAGQKSSLIWEISAIDSKVSELMDSLLNSGTAKNKLKMTGNIKDAKKKIAVKKREQDENNKPELSFVDSLLMMYKLRMKTTKAKGQCRVYDNIRLYAHNFGDFVFHQIVLQI